MTTHGDPELGQQERNLKRIAEARRILQQARAHDETDQHQPGRKIMTDTPTTDPATEPDPNANPDETPDTETEPVEEPPAS